MSDFGTTTIYGDLTVTGQLKTASGGSGGNYVDINNARISNSLTLFSGANDVVISKYSGAKIVNFDGEIRQNNVPVALSSGCTFSGPIYAKSGAGGGLNPNACGYAFSGDNDSGLFGPSDGTVDMVVNGITRARFTTGTTLYGTTTVEGTLNITYPNTINVRHIEGASGQELFLNYTSKNNIRMHGNVINANSHYVHGFVAVDQDITGFDLNNLITPNTYKGNSMPNMAATAYSWAYVEVMNHGNTTWISQRQTDLHDARNISVRHRTDSAWSSWCRITPKISTAAPSGGNDGEVWIQYS